LKFRGLKRIGNFCHDESFEKETFTGYLQGISFIQNKGLNTTPMLAKYKININKTMQRRMRIESLEKAE